MCNLRGEPERGAILITPGKTERKAGMRTFLCGRGARVAFLRMAALNHPSVPQDNNGRASREGAFQLDATTTVYVCGCEAGMRKFEFVLRRIGIVTTSTLPLVSNLLGTTFS